MDNAKRSADLPKSRTVTRADLPLSCPMPDMQLWNAHPRVFLPIDKTGEATCPYCSAHYILADKS
jgi:uncharacterized Zn-finger protein